jgi:colicin import membrane protein
MNDPELKAMAAVYEALNGLDASTRQRVADWVLAKLGSTSGTAAKPKGAKRGRKAGATKAAAKATGAKRGRKPGSKKAVAAEKSVEPKAEAKPVKKAGKRGRPAGTAKTAKKATKKAATKKSAGKRGRPRKSVPATA